MLTSVASLLIVASADTVPPRPITQLVHRTWTAKEGAPVAIRSLAQTSDGYIWLGTAAGLVRFDGVRFVQFVPQRGDTLPTVPSVSRLMAARDGSLWVVWRLGGVTRLREGRVNNYGERDGLTNAFQLAESNDGTLIAATATGLARFVGEKWEDVSRAWGYPGTQGTAVWFDRDNNLWVQTQDRIVYRAKGAREFADPGVRVVYPVRADLDQEADGTTWISEVNGSAHTLRRASNDSTTTTAVMLNSTALLIDRKGSLWVASYGQGLRRVIDPRAIRGRQISSTGREAEQYTVNDGLLSNSPEALLEDREGSIWVAGERGLERFREGPFVGFAGFGRAASLVFAARDTTLWAATFRVNDILRFDGRDRQDTVKTTFPVRSLAEDSLGTVWTATLGIVLRFDKGRFVPLRLRPTTARAISNLTFDRHGTLWLFDDQVGLFHLAGDSLVLTAPIPRTIIDRYGVFTDSRGRVWVSQLGRVALYDQGKLTMLGADQGVPPGLVYDFFEDRSGSIWAASTGGLTRFDNGRFHTITEKQGIAGSAVFGLAQDDAGAWWLATRAGVMRILPGDAERAVTDSTYSVRSRTFDASDGLPGLVPPGHWARILTRAVDGRIWVSTDSGVGVVDPKRLTHSAPPPALVEAIRVDGRELPLDALEIPAGRHDVEIDYTATTFATPERVQFRYRLEGADGAWHDAGARRRAYYTGLAPGQYHFRVAATTGDGEWAEAPTPRTFVIRPSWYQTLWARIGLVLLIVGASAGAASLVQRRRHVRAQETLRKQYDATLAERGRIAQDLHDTLLQGFAGVTLQLKTAELALPEEPDVAVETIRRVQMLARESLREARERVWDMRGTQAASEDVPAALEAVARARASGMGIEVSVATVGQRRRLDHRVEDAAFRIGREAIANAIRHASPERIEVVAEFEDTRFCLRVSDDGRGFSPEEAEEARHHGHFGLTGARQRAASLGGSCEVHSRPTGGTVVVLELPLDKALPR